VGVVDADLGLQGGDLRAAERTFQLMRQVSGRAGRADKPGVALMQTFQPEHPVIRAILGGDEEAFWRAEAAEREAAGMPPYGRLAGIIISAGDAASAFDLGQHLARNDEAIRSGGRRRLRPRARAHRAGPGSAPGAAAGQGAQGRAAAGRDQPLDRRIEAAVAGAARGGYRPAEFLLIGPSHRSRRLQAATAV
jgi:hypothetical protein